MNAREILTLYFFTYVFSLGDEFYFVLQVLLSAPPNLLLAHFCYWIYKREEISPGTAIS